VVLLNQEGAAIKAVDSAAVAIAASIAAAFALVEHVCNLFRPSVFLHLLCSSVFLDICFYTPLCSVVGVFDRPRRT